MLSPVHFDKPFVLNGQLVKQFQLLGHAHGGKGIGHTLFLSKPALGKLTAQSPVILNGFCKYSFIQSVGGICGFVIISPLSNTRVKPTCVLIGSESENYRTLHHLQPQGVLIQESTDSNTLFLALDIDSPLLVKVSVC